METNKKGVILCLMSAFCFALGPIIGKLLYSTGFPWRVVVSCRGMIPAILVFLFALFFARDVFRIKKEHIKLFLLNGLSFGFISICNYCSLYYINASVATILLYTLPVFTVLLSRFMLKEKFSVPKIIAMVLVFCGTVLIINITHMDDIAAHPGTMIWGIPSAAFGILIGLMSGFLSALYTIFTRKLNQYYDGWTVNSWCYFLGFPVFLMIGGGPIASFAWQPDLIFFIIVSALVGLSAYSLYAVSMHFIDAGKASLLVTLDPVMSVTMSVVILGETLTLLQFLGCLLVGGGILIMERGRAWLHYFQLRKEKVS